MTRNNPPKDFDITRVHLDSPSQSDYKTPKATDPEIIAARRKHPGLARLQSQHFGLHAAKELIGMPLPSEEEKSYIRNRIAIMLFNTAWYSFGETPEVVMRNRLKLPILADDSNPDNPQRLTADKLSSLATMYLDAASSASIRWQNAHINNDEKRAGKMATEFARRIGNSSLALVSFGLTDNYADTASEIQSDARQVAMQLSDQSRLSDRETGTYPTLVYLATAAPELVFPNAPSFRVLDALVQTREEIE